MAIVDKGSGQERPLLTRYREIDLTGTTNITVPSTLRMIVAVFVNWAESPDNDTYQVIAYASGTDVIVRCTHATTKKVSLRIVGTA